MWNDEILMKYRQERGWTPLSDEERKAVIKILNTLTKVFTKVSFLSWVEPGSESKIPPL